MDGHASDLRTGLPWQMVEIHEPMRLLVVVEAPPARVAAVIAAHPPLEQLAANRWLRLYALDGESGELFEYTAAGFDRAALVAVEPPGAASSAAWYGGRRDHLAIARIGAA